MIYRNPNNIDKIIYKNLSLQDYDRVNELLYLLYKSMLSLRKDLYDGTKHFFHYTREEYNNRVDKIDDYIDIGAYINTNLIGIGLSDIRKMNTRYPLTLFISDIVVDPRYRNLGIGSSILKELENQSKDHSIELLELQVLGNNKSAIDIYKGIGFGIQKLYMEKYIK